MPAMNASVTTTDPGRLINRLCKHFQHKVDAQWTAEIGELRFVIGDCHLKAADGALLMTCEAENEEKLEQVGEVVSSHLVRFAGGEVDSVQWQPSAA